MYLYLGTGAPSGVTTGDGWDAVLLFVTTRGGPSSRLGQTISSFPVVLSINLTDESPVDIEISSKPGTGDFGK
jgi:hypothetical protein